VARLNELINKSPLSLRPLSIKVSWPLACDIVFYILVQRLIEPSAKETPSLSAEPGSA
jgi:hypothetical protein